MRWKENKAVGAIAVVLAIVGVALVVYFVTSEGELKSMRTFICESTGKTFEVDIAPMENIKWLEVAPGQAAPCEFDDEDDAYQAEKDKETGEWRKMAPSTGR